MMRHAGLFIFFLSLAAINLSARVADATPVYLSPGSRFSSGNHPRTWLEGRTRKIQFQRWLRVETVDKAYGWVPEELLLTPLRLASEAVLLEATPARRERQMDAVERETLAKDSRVRIIDALGTWVRVQTASGKETWVPSEALAPHTGPSLRVFVASRVGVYVLPGEHARVQHQARTSRFLRVSKSLPGGWLEVRTAHGAGYLRSKDVVQAKDLGYEGARPLHDLIPMRSAPLPYADLVRNLKNGAHLRIVGAQTLRWGMARVSEIGEVWWPISDESADEKDLNPRERITTDELFKRKIFDMAASPAIPSLKLASAQGVFRTIDGAEWIKLPVFENKNYPIAVAGGGAIFIGPFVSDDHGETFEQWIRWDTLVATLKRSSPGISTQKLQIQEIRPEDPIGRRVVLKLALGEDTAVRLITEDQGLSWRRF